MSSSNQDVFVESLDWILRPVVRYCVRHSIKLQVIVARLKSLLTQEARDQLLKSHSEASVSRIHLMTGVHRPDVAAILLNHEHKSLQIDNVLTRVLGTWQGHRKYVTRNGRPRTLTAVGHNSEFSDLVRSVQRDLNPYSILFELERAGTIERTRNGVRVCRRFHLPSRSVETGFSILGADVSDLIFSVEENVTVIGEPPHLHIRTEYDQVPLTVLPMVQRWLRAQGSAFHRRARRFLSNLDVEVNPPAHRSGTLTEMVRVGVTSFSWSESSSAHRSKR